MVCHNCNLPYGVLLIMAHLKKGKAVFSVGRKGLNRRNSFRLHIESIGIKTIYHTNGTSVPDKLSSSLYPW